MSLTSSSTSPSSLSSPTIANILFIPLDSTGHVNACIGIGERLLARGHHVSFAIEKCWQGILNKNRNNNKKNPTKENENFEEHLYIDPSRPPGLGPNEYWLRSMKLIESTLHQDSLYKAGHQNVQEFEELIMDELYFDDQLEAIIQQVNPDIIILDTYSTYPAVYLSGRPWIHMTSANPLSVLPHPDTPPAGSGE